MRADEVLRRHRYVAFSGRCSCGWDMWSDASDPGVDHAWHQADALGDAGLLR